MAKDLRTLKVNEVRSSHFTLGYEPTVKVTSKQEDTAVLGEKWNVKRVVQPEAVPASKQNFNLNQGSNTFHGESTTGHAYAESILKNNVSPYNS